MTTIDQKDTLPNKLSDLILLALKDLTLCEKDPNYGINMNSWHLSSCGFEAGEYCQVCLAGSIIAKSLNAPIENSYRPTHFPSTIRYKLEALDAVRLGLPNRALRHLGREKQPMKDFVPVLYSRSPKKFKQSLRTVAKMLKLYGE